MIVIAHRGSSQLAPENTLPAIKQALRDRIEAIEIDVQMTKDGQVIVFHDEWLGRTTNGNGFVYDTLYAEIRRLDAGKWFHPRFTGTHVPLLAEVLKLLKDHPVTLNIELKNNLIDYPGLEKSVIDLVHRYKMENKVILSSFRVDSLQTCLSLAPHIRRGLLCWGTLDPFFSNHAWRELQLYSIHPHVALLGDNLRLLQQEGYYIFPYVIERKSQLTLCQDFNVDGVFTNCPRRIKKLLRQN
ncbi:glycerophosphoryl diester phosphodiesterase [Caldalkalibacillus thermarum TA2.A1]|uniref:Glycerophosphodiester phosphodiesterase n=1 Tax=Caldalkalibacillus thermarum (strain TA2.A1) TaxID=986075 RepID=F5LAA7_CALTT|nr:glycerophosphodiester phosphodiesterase family protein [Caldalkalibacillus thermarum]EGL81656.1 glycerophosphoryl diester phosphodiesterase [Caldalkalibacillus thermarum TA2.A1]QZT33253.1 glycerophosphodiester phosphodiesterase [Caldalkalibacillus thermarum TA2.A1]